MLCAAGALSLLLALLQQPAAAGSMPMATAVTLFCSVLWLVLAAILPWLRIEALTPPVCLLAFGASALWAAGQRAGLPAGLSTTLLLHIALATLACAFLLMAVLQAMLVVRQAHRLRQHARPRGLPPLETGERNTFRLLGAGYILLTITLASGAVFVDSLSAQQMTHKVAFVLMSWLLLSALLLGRQLHGWRGRQALHWLLAAFSLLVIGYFGSKFVLQMLGKL